MEDFIPETRHVGEEPVLLEESMENTVESLSELNIRAKTNGFTFQGIKEVIL